MSLEEFLEKYSVTMNQKEINDIKDSRIQSIKRKYWELHHKAFLDEHRIPDNELFKEFDRLKELEQKELKECYYDIYSK